MALSTGDVARRLGCARWEVAYALERSGIQPVGRAGGVRLFGEDQVSAIAAAVAGRQARGTALSDKPDSQVQVILPGPVEE